MQAMKPSLFLFLFLIFTVLVYGNSLEKITVKNHSFEKTASLTLAKISEKTRLTSDQQEQLKEALIVYESSRDSLFSESASTSKEVAFSSLVSLYDVYRETERSILTESQEKALYEELNLTLDNRGLNGSSELRPLSSPVSLPGNITFRDTIKTPQTIFISYRELLDNHEDLLYWVDFGEGYCVTISWEADLAVVEDYISIYEIPTWGSLGEHVHTVRGVSKGNVDTQNPNGRAAIYIGGGVMDGNTSRKGITLTFSLKPVVFGNFSVLGTTYFNDKVGIGVANPKEKLEVNGNIKTTKLITTGDIQLGGFAGENDSYGKKLYFGDPSDNTDPFFISRYNVSSDVSELRVNLGDDQMDKFVVGSNFYWSSGFTPALTVLMSGHSVGINNNDPREQFRL